MEILALDQTWTMFAPTPTTFDGWLTVPAVFEDGQTVDVLTQDPINNDMPRQNFGYEMRWKKYAEYLYRFEDVALLSALGDHFCWAYNTHDALPEGHL